MAMRGTGDRFWRNDAAFLKAKISPVGHPNRIGNWAVFGVSRGYQVGRHGRSYAIETIRHPGQIRSTPLSEIESQFCELFAFAEANSDLEFLMTPVGCGLSGYLPHEIEEVFATASNKSGIPLNVVVPKGLWRGR
jgi:hypothetical protein